jgi:hypothetical protein
MAEITFSPRLRNSSINGIRFKTELDPVVKKHLAELDVILGQPVFLEKTPSGNYGSNLRKEYEAAKAEAEKAKAEAEKADHDAAAAESSAASMKGKNGSENTAAEERENEVKAKRSEANMLAKMAQQKLDKAETLERLMKAKTSPDFGNPSRRTQLDVEELFMLPLVAKKTNKQFEGVLGEIEKRKGTNPKMLTVSECIDKVNELSSLKNSLQQYLAKNWNSLDENQKAVLNNKEYKNVFDYLLAYGYFVRGITEISAMFNFMKSHRNGSNAVVKYVAISTARAIVKKSSLQIAGIDNDDSAIVKQIAEANISFSSDSFSKELDKMFKVYINNSDEMALIEHGLQELQIEISDDDLPRFYLPHIIKYMRSSKVEIDRDNITYFLPIFINRVKGDVSPVTDEATEEPEISDKDFDVEFYEDEKDSVTKSLSNVLCASQLFSAAIMENDLDIFNLANYLTNDYLIRNRVDLVDPRLRRNLELFVFSNRFKDVKTGMVLDRTKPAERQHFYNQVFNMGNGQVPNGLMVNHKFPKLWNRSAPEVKKFLDEASSSLSENTFVSKGGVMQIVAGLQNNLSANCTSMAKIISPIINGEWNFIINKIFGHPEIIKQVSPSVPSWKGVAETLYGEMKKTYVDASLVYDKVKISNEIIRKIAEYEPRKFEDDNNFMDFCSLVIQLDDVSNSIYTDNHGYDDEDDHDEVGEDVAQYMPANNVTKAPTGKGGNSDWDF